MKIASLTHYNPAYCKLPKTNHLEKKELTVTLHHFLQDTPSMPKNYVTTAQHTNKDLGFSG